MLHAGGNVTAEGEACTQHEVPLDLQAGVILSLCQIEQLAADACRLLVLGTVEVVGSEASEHREQPRQFARLLRDLLEVVEDEKRELGVQLLRHRLEQALVARPGQADSPDDSLEHPVRVANV